MRSLRLEWYVKYSQKNHVFLRLYIKCRHLVRHFCYLVNNSTIINMHPVILSFYCFASCRKSKVSSHLWMNKHVQFWREWIFLSDLIHSGYRTEFKYTSFTHFSNLRITGTNWCYKRGIDFSELNNKFELKNVHFLKTYLNFDELYF